MRKGWQGALIALGVGAAGGAWFWICMNVPRYREYFGAWSPPLSDVEARLVVWYAVLAMLLLAATTWALIGRQGQPDRYSPAGRAALILPGLAVPLMRTFADPLPGAGPCMGWLLLAAVGAGLTGMLEARATRSYRGNYLALAISVLWYVWMMSLGVIIWFDTV